MGDIMVTPGFYLRVTNLDGSCDDGYTYLAKEIDDKKRKQLIKKYQKKHPECKIEIHEHKLRVNKEGYLDFRARIVTDSEGTKLVKWECPRCYCTEYSQDVEYVTNGGILCCYHCCCTWG